MTAPPSSLFTYRRIAHKVEAVCWRSDLTAPEIPNWLWAALDPNKTDSPVTRVGDLLHVKTPTGLVIAQEGHWIVRNQWRQIEVYKPEEFARTFERDQRPERNRVRGWKDEKEDEPRGSKRT
jgi:hypothetical protein